MYIHDEIWGTWELNDPLIIELINSAPIQRLKKINNDGANRYLYEMGEPTRFKHSMGVLYLANRFSKQREDHIMAILHDVAHTAFSHVVDFVFEKGDTQDFHEEAKKKLLEDTEVKDILIKYGYRPNQFYEKDKFPIVGNGKNQTNIDRIDYFMRDGVGIKLINPQIANTFINNLSYDELNQEFYFTDIGQAATFTLVCLTTSSLAYSSANAIGSTYLLSEALKRALKLELITEDDLMLTDDVIMKRLKNSSDEVIKSFISRLNRKTQFELCDKEESEYSTKNKFRYIDPLVRFSDGSKRNVSQLVSNLKDHILKFEKDGSYVSIRQTK